jgi:hypothetical protein
VGLEWKFVAARGCGRNGGWMTCTVQQMSQKRYSIKIATESAVSFKCSFRVFLIVFSILCHASLRYKRCRDEKASLVSSSNARSTRCWNRREGDYSRVLHHSRVANRLGLSIRQVANIDGYSSVHWMEGGGLLSKQLRRRHCAVVVSTFIHHQQTTYVPCLCPP